MKQRILVVEDETAIASVLDALLTEAGYEVTLATDGVQGLQAFHRQSFSLILLDLMMPQVDGYTVCRQIRQESQVPIVVLTALDGEDAQVKAFQLKADDYITKPLITLPSPSLSRWSCCGWKLSCAAPGTRRHPPSGSNTPGALSAWTRKPAA